jgi:hypothetical protein
MKTIAGAVYRLATIWQPRGAKSWYLIANLAGPRDHAIAPTLA